MSEIKEPELIANQVVKIANLTVELDELEKALKDIILTMVCIGGPLNDNVLGYTTKQLTTFSSILERAETALAELNQ